MTGDIRRKSTRYAMQQIRARKRRGRTKGMQVGKVVPAHSRLVWGQAALKARQRFGAKFHIAGTADGFLPAKTVCCMIVFPKWSRFGDDCRRPSHVLG